MRINYNITGTKRKSLVDAMSQELNVPVKYLGAPTFAYEVGGYHIDKNGTLTGKDDSNLIADLQGLHGFIVVSEEYDIPIPEAESVPDDIQIPYEASLGGLVSPYHDEEEPPAYGTPKPTETIGFNSLTIEMPLESFTEESISNLDRLIASKAILIKKAVGAQSLPVIQTESTLQFPWFSFNATGDEVSAYTCFISALCTAAKEQKRVTATEKMVENEKFAFRVFLIRLGFVGDEYKSARKILIKNLSGNSAFKNGTPPKTEMMPNE